MEPNQSLDPSSLDPNTLATLQQMAGQSQIQQQEGDKMHPMDAMHAIAASSGIQRPPIAPQLSYMAPDNPKYPHGFFGGLANMFSPNPESRELAPIAVTNQAPDPAVYKALGLQAPPSVGMDKQGNPLYDYAEANKQSEKLISAKALGMKSIQPPSDIAALLASGDATGAIKLAQSKYGLDSFPTQWLAQGTSAQGANARMTMANAASTRTENQTAKMLADVGEQAAGLKTNGDYKNQNDRVSNVIHGFQTLEQAYDPKTKQFNVNPVFIREAAMAAARATVGNQQLTNEMIDGIQQRSAQGDLAGALAYATGDPTMINAAPDKIIDMYGQMLVRQGLTAQQLRDKYIQGAVGSNYALKQLHPQEFQKTLEGAAGKAPDFSSYLARSPLAARYKDQIGQTQLLAPGSGALPTNQPPTSVPKLDAATRFNQLMQANLSKKQAYALMHKEGY